MNLRIFASSALDSTPERECLETLVKELNQPGECASQINVKLEIHDWGMFLNKYLTVSPNNNIDLPLEPWDIFVGILRFCCDGGMGSGSEEVFEQACNVWKETGKPRLLLFRSHRDFSVSNIDWKQFKKVQEFFDRNAGETRKPTPYRAFKELTEFSAALKEFLKNHLEAEPEKKAEKDAEPEKEEDSKSDSSLELTEFAPLSRKALLADNQVSRALDILVSYDIFKNLKK